MSLDNEFARSRVEAIRKAVAGPPDERDTRLTDADRNILVKFDDALTRQRKKNNRCGWYHHGNLLNQLYVFALETDCLARSLEDGREGDEALKEIIDWIHDQDYSGYTIQGKLSTLRVFADTVLEEMPERFAEIQPSKHVETDPAPLPSNIIEYVDVLNMVRAATSTRDKALVLVQWGAGLRPMEELYTLQRKNVQLMDDHVVITLPSEGKTDRRELLILVGSPMLKKWIQEEHPVHDDPEASMGPDTFIWTKMNRNKLLRYRSLQRRFYEAGEKAGIEKDHSPQHFRRSAASVLAGQPHISERDLRYRFSWSPNSAAPEHYIAANSEATKVNVARCRGRDVDSVDDSPDTAPVPCERCGEWTTRGLEECIWCNYNLDADQQTIDDLPAMQHPEGAGERSLEERLLDGDVTSDELRVLRQFKTDIMSDPDLFEKLDELIVKAEALEESNMGDAVDAATPAGLLASLSQKASSKLQRVVQLKHTAMSLHPAFEHYPPRGKRLGKLVAAEVLLVAGFVAWAWYWGSIQALMAGDPVEWTALVIGLPLGLWTMFRAMPDVDEAAEQRFGTE